MNGKTSSASEKRRRFAVEKCTLRTAEAGDGEALLTFAQEQAIRAAFRAAGVHFQDDVGSGAGVRLRSLPNAADEGLRPQELTSENDG